MSPDRPHRQPVLSPAERQSEVLFGLIMALSFTCTISVAEAGRTEVRTMLWAALGCNTAWGIVDAVMYLLNTIADRGQSIALFRRFRAAATPEAADAVVRDALPPALAGSATAEDVARLRERLKAVPEPRAAHLRLNDLVGALAVFLLVLLSTFPVALPFVFIADAHRALRVSNAVALVMLFVLGWRMGVHSAIRPLTMAGAMVAIGLACVGVTIALGG